MTLVRRSGGPAAPLAIAAGLVALVFAAYARAFGHSFLDWDDGSYVTGNALVLGRQYGALLRAVVSHNFHPLTLLTLAWNVGTPLSPRPFLVTNVALHALDTLLVFWLVLGISGRRLPVAAFVALLFAVHPLHVESVAWISERKDVLYAAFYLAGLIAYWRHLERPSGRFLALSFALFVLSCLAKGMAVSFPLAMLLLDHWKGRPLLERRAILEKLPFLAVALVFGMVAVRVQAGGDLHGLLAVPGRSLPVIPAALPYTPLERATLPAFGYLMYAWRLLVPGGLCAFDPYPSPGEAGQAVYRMAPLFLLATLALAIWDARRTRVLSFGLGWYFVTVVFVLQWIPVGMAIMADRYAYLPLIGLAFVLAMGMQSVLERSRPLGIGLWCAGGLFAVLLFVQTTRQVDVWRDSESLWTRAVEVHPRSGQAWLFRGTARLKAARIPEAWSDLQSALRLGNHDVDLYDGLGSVYGMRGQPDSALAMFDRVLRVDPGRGRTQYNRALALMMLSRPREAVAALDLALPLAPEATAQILRLRGLAHLRLAEYPSAAGDLDRAIAAGARDAECVGGRGYCRLQFGDRAGAITDFRAALRLDPGYAPARKQLETLGAD